MGSSSGAMTTGLQVGANLSSVPLGHPRKSSATRKSVRHLPPHATPPLLDDETVVSGLSHPAVGQCFFFSLYVY